MYSDRKDFSSIAFKHACGSRNQHMSIKTTFGQLDLKSPKITFGSMDQKFI